MVACNRLQSYLAIYKVGSLLKRHKCTAHVTQMPYDLYTNSDWKCTHHGLQNMVCYKTDVKCKHTTVSRIQITGDEHMYIVFCK